MRSNQLELPGKKKKGWCPVDCDTSSEDYCCDAKAYTHTLLRSTFNHLRVAVLNNNAPFTSLVGGTWTGFDIDLLREVVSRIPCIRHLDITGYDTEEAALDSVLQGTNSLYANSNSLITPLNLQNQLGALATNLGGVPVTTQNVYALANSVAGIAVQACALGGLDIDTFLTCLSTQPGVQGVGMGPGTIQNELLTAAGIPVAAQLVVPPAALGSAQSIANYFTSVIGPSLQAPVALGDIAFLTSVAGVGFTPAELANAQPPLVQATLTLPASLVARARGWYYRKEQSFLSLWLAFAFDQAVAGGAYASLVSVWFPVPLPGIATPIAPPAQYSFAHQLVPPSAVYNAYLGPLECIDQHSVKVTNVTLL